VSLQQWLQLLLQLLGWRKQPALLLRCSWGQLYA
jgi:hypothetical protein